MICAAQQELQLRNGYVPSWICHACTLEDVRYVVKERYEGEVFNLEVEDDHSYVADGWLVHNCQHCIRLHLGPDGQPRIFRLTDLEANGSNFRKRATDWLPVVGATHPHCQCQLLRVPAGWGFDEEGDLVPGGELGIAYEGEEDIHMALRQEMDLQKSFKLQGHIEFQGMDVAVENHAGSYRVWKDRHGNQGKTRMKHPYGYIKCTGGADEDEIDAYVGPDPRAESAYIVHQLDPDTGVYDEDKVMLGFSNASLAKQAYLAHYDRPGFFGGMTAMTMDQLKRWIAGTGPRPGEGIPKGKRLVIPLKKAQVKGRVDPSIAAQTSRAAHRNPGPGTVVNYVVGTKRVPPPTLKDAGYDPDEKDITRIEHERRAIKRDKSVYDLAERLERETHKLEIPADFHAGRRGPDEAEERKHRIQQAARRNRGRPKNTTEPEQGIDLAGQGGEA